KNPPAPPRVVSPCPTPDGGGGWEHITPPDVSIDPDFPTPAGQNYGPVAFVVDPHDFATLYLGTSAQGIFKTTDCGGTWQKINTGAGAGDMDLGRQVTMVIDYIDSKIIYADNRYGPGGVFKSTDGGVSWKQMVPPNVLEAFIHGGQLEWLAIDPTDHLHLT